MWAIWLLHSVVIDLSDGVAAELSQLFTVISVEMVYRVLYHYSRALARGNQLSIFQYLAQIAKLLGIIKRPRPKRVSVQNHPLQQCSNLLMTLEEENIQLEIKIAELEVQLAQALEQLAK